MSKYYIIIVYAICAAKFVVTVYGMPTATE
nr:MAG TPA: hypothetical protein [Caudoviricetes sp.]DAZ35808.1 MAG TPA: hypothetical protein [Caudoviricetes sp.]